MEMCSAERSGGYFYTMCQTPRRRRRRKELRPSPPSMAIGRPDQALLPFSSGTTKGHRESQCLIPAALCWVRAKSQGWRDAGTQHQPRRGPAWRGMSRVVHLTAQDTDPHCTHTHSLFVWVFPLFPFSRGKSPRGAWKTAGCFPSPLCALQQ